MDQVMSFVGRNKDLAQAIDEAQAAANTWLHQHGMSIVTIYSASNQSVWDTQQRTWYHVIMLALQYHGANLPPTPDTAPGDQS